MSKTSQVTVLVITCSMIMLIQYIQFNPYR